MDRKLISIGLGAHIVASACYNPSLAPDEFVSVASGDPEATTEIPPGGSTSETPSGSTDNGTTTDGLTGAFTDSFGMSATSTTETSTPMTSTTAVDTTGTTGFDTVGTVAADPGVCGDGMVDPGEQCDAGMMNGDDQSCTPGCLDNICGDGKPGPGEGCDDGNLTPNDGCSLECTAEHCGDGKKQPLEACDDGNQTNNDGCSNACTLPACGDKIVQAGEQCDDSGESATCDSDCSTVSCGDGTLNMSAGETCDDGNKVDTDACTATCKTAKCGDTVVQAGVEACDDGNPIDDDACSKVCQVNSLRVFISSTVYSGNLGGPTGADQKCKALAVGLGGTWMAWISSVLGPADRFTTKGGPKPYVLIDGKLIAKNWAELISKNLLTTIHVSEKNTNVVDSAHVWTNTKPDGTPTVGTNHCMSWSIGVGNLDGGNGLRTSIDAKWTQESYDACNTLNHLYCFEQ